MSIVYAVKNGDWSDTTTWNAGVVPDEGDDVYSNSYTVGIDQDVSADLITNKAKGDVSIASGGYFDFQWLGAEIEETRTVNANIAVGGFQTATMVSNGSYQKTIIINGNVEGAPSFPDDPATSERSDVLGISLIETNIVVNGDIISHGDFQEGLLYMEDGTIEIHGDVTGPGAIAGWQEWDEEPSTKIFGNILPGVGMYEENLGYGGWVNFIEYEGPGVVVMDAYLYIEGDIQGPSSSALQFKSNDASVSVDGRLHVVGDVVAGDSLAVLVNGALFPSEHKTEEYPSNYTVLNGDAIPDQSVPAMFVNGYSPVFLIGENQVSDLGVFGIFSSAIVRVKDSDFTVYYAEVDLEAEEMLGLFGYGGEEGVIEIREEDVRRGVHYGSKVGIMDIPKPEQVAFGVPVDGTIGTSAIKLDELVTITGEQIASVFRQ